MLFLLFTAMIFSISISNCYAQDEISGREQLLAHAEYGNLTALRKLFHEAKQNGDLELAYCAFQRSKIRILQETVCHNEDSQKIQNELLAPKKLNAAELKFYEFAASMDEKKRTEIERAAIEWAELHLTKNYGQSSCDTESLLKKQEILQQLQQRKIKKTTTVSEQEKPALTHRNSFREIIHQFFKGRGSKRRDTI
jgi:hypothetical protein